MTTGLSAAVLSLDEAKAELSLSLVGVPRATPLTLDCALLRALIWSLTRSREPAHVHRILNQAERRASIYTPAGELPEVRERLRRTLDELADGGDLLDLGGGRWFPAGVREVPLGELAGERLLVGGLPTGVLPALLRAEVTHHGAARRLRTGVLREALGLPVEELDSWTRAPLQPLESWAERLLTSPLSPYSEPESEAGSLRVYVPRAARRGTPQRWRWTEQLEGLTGTFLGERSRYLGVREVYLLELRGGRPVRIGAVIRRGEIRRLMYALDAESENPVEVGWIQDGGTLRVTLWSELPRSEQRLFAALGTLDEGAEGYYPRLWRFEREHAALVGQRLDALGVQLVSTLDHRRVS